MNKGLKLLDQLVAEGRGSVTPALVMERTGVSRQAAVNMLQRLRRAGLIERVGHGHYVIRGLGVMGTSAVAEDLALAVGSRFAGRPHRIAFRSALERLGVLSHPWTSVQVATPLRMRQRVISGRPLQIVHESESTLLLGAIALREGAWASGYERALLDCAARPDLAGGADVLAEALVSESPDAARLLSIAKGLGSHAPLRRIGSVADALGRGSLCDALWPQAGPIKSDIELDPTLKRMRLSEDAGFRDKRWRVRWRISPAELVAEARQ